MARSAVETHVGVVPVHDMSQDVFTNEKYLTFNCAIDKRFLSLRIDLSTVSTASATVPDNFYVNSSQSSWLRPVTEKAKGKVTYHVERTTAGRSYAMRLVRAMADGACVYIAMIWFQHNKQPVANSLTYDEEMPKLISSPEDIPQEHSVQFTASRLCTRLRTHATQSLSTNTPAINLAGLAYASDRMLAGMAAAASPMAVGKGGRNIALITSLTHNVFFLNPTVQIGQWMVTERRTTWGANERVLVHQRLWDWKTGRLVMSVDQEAMIGLGSYTKL
ncbi:Thioesterase/thiol ester dehydrase-isomerase [Astrocystis sublimbata]|nr:Thioesterase/thiol ester dehydrase-isomerase [Astrocystis sublimbata]